MTDPIRIRKVQRPRQFNPLINQMTTSSARFLVEQAGVQGGVHGMMSPGRANYWYPSKDNPQVWEPTEAKGQYQGKLFETDFRPPVVQMLYATPDARHLVPTALGAMIEESRAKYGANPVPAESLSRHSSRLVRRLLDDKLVDPKNEENLGDNNQTFDDSYLSVGSLQERMPDLTPVTTELSPEQVKSAQNTAREALFPKRNRNLSTQFKDAPAQGELF